MTWQRYNKNLRKSPLLAEYFSFFDKFDSILSSVIDSHLELRSTLIGYQYSEIIRHIVSRPIYLRSLPRRRLGGYNKAKDVCGHDM